MKNFFENLPVIIPLCIAVAAMAVTITKGKIFLKQRIWLRLRSPWIGKLFSCPYCLCHWLIAVTMIWYHPILTNLGYVWVDLVITGFCLIGISALYIGLIVKLFSFKPDPGKQELTYIETLINALKQAREVIEQQKLELKK